jgi:arylformamidase
MSTEQRWIDVTVPIRDGMVHWPDNPDVQVGYLRHLSRGDVCTVSTLAFGSHTGTHVDAPSHFLPTGDGIDDVPLEATLGPARVIEVTDERAIGVEAIDRLAISPGERLLFKTRNSTRCWGSDAFVSDYVFLSLEAARLLIALRVRTIGIDYLSIGGGQDGEQVHRELLQAGICIIEGLDLTSVSAGRYELVCLPLRIQGGDGAPARVVLRPLAQGG